jgi:hypothetical protein
MALPLVGKVPLGGALMGLSALVIVFTITSALHQVGALAHKA